MKKKEWMVGIVMALVCAKYFAEDIDIDNKKEIAVNFIEEIIDREKNAAKLATALCIPNESKSHISSAPIFKNKSTIKVGDFQMKQRSVEQLVTSTDIEIFDMNNKKLAFGYLFERAFFESACKDLLQQILCSSMDIDSLIDIHKMQVGEIGDFCIVGKNFGKTLEEFTIDTTRIHFVRGCKAVTLRAIGETKDVRPIAKAIDAMLLETAIAEKQSSEKKDKDIVPNNNAHTPTDAVNSVPREIDKLDVERKKSEKLIKN